MIDLAYLAARLFGLPAASRRAVALETGIQNSPLSFAIILGSFPVELQDKMLRLPLLYALLVLFSASIATAVFRRSSQSATA